MRKKEQLRELFLLEEVQNNPQLVEYFRRELTKIGDTDFCVIPMILAKKKKGVDNYA